MKRNFFIAFALLSSVIAVISYKSLQACGGGDLNYEWQAIFTPEVTELDSTLSPMFYATESYWYNSYSDWNWKEDQAIVEWKEFFGSEVSEEALRFYLFSLEGDKEFVAILKNDSPGSTYPSLNWSTPKMKEFKTFLKLAKEVDKAADGRNFSWNYKPQKEVFAGDLFVEEIEKKYRESTNEIMKLKWWFQTAKAKYYSSNKKSLISFMSETEAAVQKGTYYYRALSYLGGVYHQEGN